MVSQGLIVSVPKLQETWGSVLRSASSFSIGGEKVGWFTSAKQLRNFASNNTI